MTKDKKWAHENAFSQASDYCTQSQQKAQIISESFEESRYRNLSFPASKASQAITGNRFNRPRFRLPSQREHNFSLHFKCVDEK